VNPSVLILSEEMMFLLDCYSSLHQDARIGRVETVTDHTEAVKLLATFRPDVVVIDASATGRAGLAGLIDGCRLPRSCRIVVTCQPDQRATIGPEARAVGAVGLLNRDSFSARSVLRAAELRIPHALQEAMSEAVKALESAALA
jgi:DNA-binding NarL/FixJ family response regulator